MWFSGKRYRRTRCENFEAWMEASNVSKSLQEFIMNKAPVFSFTRIDDETIRLVLEIQGRYMNRVFKLGVEQEVERIDGTKVKFTYTLEGDSVLKQVIKQPDGRVSELKREFGEKESKLTITTGGSDIKVTIYFEEIK